MNDERRAAETHLQHNKITNQYQDQNYGCPKRQWTALALGILVAALSTTLTTVEADYHAQGYRNTPLLQPLLGLKGTQNQHIELDLPGTDLIKDESEAKTDGQWLKATVEKGDTLAHISQKLGIEYSQINQFLDNKVVRKHLKTIIPGQELAFYSENGQLVRIDYTLDAKQALSFEQSETQITVTPIEREIDRHISHGSGVIYNSLFEAGQDSGIPEGVIMEMAGIFGWDIDFALDIRSGDSFSVIYEELFLNGEKIADGNILAAEFINQGQVYRSVRYTNPEGKGEYYTPEGHNMRKEFLRTPVDFTRISSRFGRRYHPVLNRIKTHQGVDYAAAAGTPIRATGDGKVVFIGRKGGYGKTVILQHGGKYTTLYAHMRHYNRRLRRGNFVRQGQVIGYVGQSGLATGPHLHYEFRVHGTHRNPLTVRFPKALPIENGLKDDFQSQTSHYLAFLDALKPTAVASR